MILNRLEPGTECTVIKTGEKGVLKQIYFYPTKFELEFPDGRVSHFTTKQLEIDGISQTEATFKTPLFQKTVKESHGAIGTLFNMRVWLNIILTPPLK